MTDLDVAIVFRRTRVVAEVLKKRFPNLTVDETLELAEKILMALEGK